MLVNIVDLLIFPIGVINVLPQVAPKFSLAQGLGFLNVAATFCYLWSFICSVFIPTVLSFTPRAQRERRESQASVVSSMSSPSRIQSRGEPVKRPIELSLDAEGLPQVDLDEVLADPVGVACYRKFAVELFKVENVEYFVRVKAYQKLKDEDAIREESASIYHTFIEEGAVLQLNISFKMRSHYDQLQHDGFFERTKEDKQETMEIGETTLRKEHPSDHMDSPSTPRHEAIELVSVGYDMKEVPSPSGSKEMWNEEQLMYTPPLGPINPPSAETSQHPIIPSPSLTQLENKSEPSKSPPKQYRTFRRVGFKKLTREIRRLIMDDWFDFLYSHYGQEFFEDLKTRADQKMKGREQTEHEVLNASAKPLLDHKDFTEEASGDRSPETKSSRQLNENDGPLLFNPYSDMTAAVTPSLNRVESSSMLSTGTIDSA